MAIKNKQLKKDINDYVELLTKSLTFERYNRRTLISERAEETLTDYFNGKINLEGVDLKLFTDYINIFAPKAQKKEMLAKFQQAVTFDVDKYLQKSKRNIFRVEPVRSMPGWLLKWKYRSFRSACRRSVFSSSAMRKADRLYTEAEEYLRSYLKKSVTIKDKDAKALYNYFCVMFAERNSDVQEALDSLDKQIKASTQKPKQKSKFSWRSLIPNKKTLLALLVTISGAWGLKMCNPSQNDNSSNQQPKIAQTISKDTISTPKKDVKTLSFSEESSKLNISQSAQADTLKKQENLSYLEADREFCDGALDLFLTPEQKASLYKRIEQQTKLNRFSLPENVSKERLAYAYVMYDKYNVPSSLKSAIFSNQKLSSAEMARLNKDIHAVGERGQGVQQMALSKHKKLSSYSAYDHAPKHAQQRHIKNLKTLKQLKKQATR